MGRLSEYDEEEQSFIEYPELEKREDRLFLDAQLGAKVRKLLASGEPPEAFLHYVWETPGAYTAAAWAWFREQLSRPGEDEEGA